MNVAPDQTIILGRQIFIDHRSLSSIEETPGVLDMVWYILGATW